MTTRYDINLCPTCFNDDVNDCKLTRSSVGFTCKKNHYFPHELTILNKYLDLIKYDYGTPEDLEKRVIQMGIRSFLKRMSGKY